MIIKKNYKILLAYLHDIFTGLVSFFVAFALRYSITNYNFLDRLPNLPEKIFILISVQSITFAVFGLYRGLWRFSSTHDLKQIIKASITNVVIVSTLFVATDNMTMVPRSSLFIYFCFLILTTGGGRFLYRMFKEFRIENLGENSVIIGAGDAGEQLLRDIKRSYTRKYNLIGILDDRANLKGRSIHGVRVLGQIDCLAQISKKLTIKKVFIAIHKCHSRRLT